MVTEEYETLKSRFVPWLSRDAVDVEREGAGTDVPTLLMAPEALLTMTGWKSSISPARSGPSASWTQCLGGGANWLSARKDDRVVAHNVWGLIPGSDSTLSDEIVVLTSHYDHVGVDKSGDVFNGADDDGSGTVSLLENAQAWMEAKLLVRNRAAPYSSSPSSVRRRAFWVRNGTATTRHSPRSARL